MHGEHYKFILKYFVSNYIYDLFLYMYCEVCHIIFVKLILAVLHVIKKKENFKLLRLM